MGLVVKNVEHGMTLPGGQFVPFRGSSDYDPVRAGEPKKWAAKWVYEDKPRKRKKVVKRRKTTAKKAAAKKATAKRSTAKRKTVAIGRSSGSGLRAYALAASRAKGGRRGVAMSRNGRSYVQKGVRPPRGWTPYPGAVVYISGVKTRLGKPIHGEYQTMYPLHPPVHGTTAMGDRNLMQVVRVPEGETVKNPIPVNKWTTAKVMRTKTGDVKVMLPGRR